MILKYLSEKIQTSLKNENLKNAEEIRIRLNKPLFVIYGNREKKFDYISDNKDIEETFSRICRYSPYAYIEDIKKGYITIDGGCRVGICGDVVDENNVKNITSLNIRIAKQIIGCSNNVINKISGNVLIASPPCCGKTTMLRDIVRVWSNSGKNIGVADERGEISGGGQLDLGERTDVILNCSKVRGMEMLLRSMAPDVIAVDELGGNEDISAAFKILNSGVNLLATIHSSNIDEVKYKLGTFVFDYVVFLKGTGTVDKIYNREYKIIWQ